MDRHVMWAAWDGPGLEHLHLRSEGGSIIADGVVLGLTEGVPFRVRYTIICDEMWQMRAADVVSLGDDGREVRLRTDGSGRWTTAHGEALPDLAGCREVDISATPFTNSLPIRRLSLAVGHAADIPAAYIDVADFTVTAVPQRYTRLAPPAGETLYLYQGLRWDFRADLPVDADGLVTDYPGFFKRVWAR